MDELPSAGEAFSIQRSITHGFTALRLAAAPLWLAGLLMSISDCNGSGRWIGDLAELGSDDDRAGLVVPVRAGEVARAALSADSLGGELRAWLVPVIVVALVFGLVIALGMFALNAWLTTGNIRLHVAVLEHGTDALGPLFSGRDRLWPMVGYKLLAGLAWSAAALVAAWPGLLLLGYGLLSDRQPLVIAGTAAALLLALPAVIYVALGTYLGEHAVVLEQLSPGHALRRSFALAAQGRLALLGFAVVCILVEIVGAMGILLCCIGVLATAPFARSLTGFAKTESFLVLTRGFGAAASYRLWQLDATSQYGGQAMPMAPPPPQPFAGRGPGEPPEQP